MRVGVPTETKSDEYRVAITPAGVRELSVHGHEVVIQAGAGNAIHLDALPVLQRLGIRLARRGGAPERPYEGGRGFAFEPGALRPPHLVHER